MKIYKLGDENKPAIMLLSDISKNWKDNFGSIVTYLTNTYYVMAVGYDGYCDDEDSTFTDVTDQAMKIEKYIVENYGGHMHAIYAYGMGGNILALIAQRGVISADAFIFDCAEMEQSIGLFTKSKAKIIADRAYKEAQSKDATKFIKQDSIYNFALSAVGTKIDKKILPKQANVHIIYCTQMGEMYHQRYLHHFASPDIMMFDYNKGELMEKYPKNLSIIIRKCTKNLK